MSDSPHFDELRDTLWYQLECRCDYCGGELDLSEIERVRDRDVMAWSRVAAERALEAGWLPIEGKIALICPGCQVRKN